MIKLRKVQMNSEKRKIATISNKVKKVFKKSVARVRVKSNEKKEVFTLPELYANQLNLS